jgi:hypothetical protein
MCQKVTNSAHLLRLGPISCSRWAWPIVCSLTRNGSKREFIAKFLEHKECSSEDWRAVGREFEACSSHVSHRGFSLIIFRMVDASHGWTITIISLSRVLVDLDIGYRSMCVRVWCELVCSDTTIYIKGWGSKKSTCIGVEQSCRRKPSSVSTPCESRISTFVSRETLQKSHITVSNDKNLLFIPLSPPLLPSLVLIIYRKC